MLDRPFVYVAGPYTNPDPVENTRRAVFVGMHIYDMGAVPLIPHLTMFAHYLTPKPIDFWYEFDLAQLAHCDALFRFEGASTGADKEVAFATERGIPVFRGLDQLARFLARPTETQLFEVTS